MKQEQTHGGSRVGAGRPKGSGKYSSPTKPMRIPVAMQDQVVRFVESRGFKLPFYESMVQAGGPSAVTDEFEPAYVDIFDNLVMHPEESFLIRATGESMIDVGIQEGDLLVVDQHIAVKTGSIVIASVNGEYTVKRLAYDKGRPILMPENPEFSPIEVNEQDEVSIIGVVTNAIHKFN